MHHYTKNRNLLCQELSFKRNLSLQIWELLLLICFWRVWHPHLCFSIWYVGTWAYKVFWAHAIKINQQWQLLLSFLADSCYITFGSPAAMELQVPANCANQLWPVILLCQLESYGYLSLDCVVEPNPKIRTVFWQSLWPQYKLFSMCFYFLSLQRYE